MFRKLFSKSTPLTACESTKACPNCWGNQAYADTYLDAKANDNVENKSKSKLGWIQAYVQEKLLK